MRPDARPTATPPPVERAIPRNAAATTDEPDKQFQLTLSHGQVQELMQQDAASRGGGRGLLGVLLALNGSERIELEELRRDEQYHDRGISQTVIRSLLVLSAFASGETHGVNSLAKELGISSSTAWRYLKTWVAIGVLEERKDRRYQLARQWVSSVPQTARRGAVGRT